MTNEEIKKLECIIKTYLPNDFDIEMFNKAIQALETQPTSDDEIIKALKAVRTIHNGNYAPQIDEAIRRLKEQPCEDCISREAVEEITFQEPSYTDPYNILTEVREKVRALPPIQPKTAEERPVFCIDRREAIKTIHNIKGYKALDGSDMIRRDALLDEFAVLHSVQPQRKRGKWIFETRKRLVDETDDGLIYREELRCKCESCGADFGFQKVDDKFCKYCGSYNGGGEDDIR